MIDYNQLAIPKGPSRFSAKQQKRAEEAKQVRECYRLVDLRDRRICRVCGKPSRLDAVGLLERGHRHHLHYRSRGGVDASENVVTLCAGCHDQIHTQATLRLEGDADQRDPLTNRLNGIAVYRVLESGWSITKWV